MQNSAPENIILRMPNWLGDAVMAAPVIEDLRTHFPRSKITLMCQGKVGDLFLHDPHVDEIFSFKKPSGWIHRIAARNILAPLRHSAYDTGILLTNSLSSAWCFWRGHVQNRIGFSGNIRNLFLTKALPYPPNKEELHQVQLYKFLLRPLGIEVSETRPKLYLSPEELQAGRELLHRLGINSSSKVIGINPGAAYGNAKCWLPERFVEVSRLFLEDPDTYLIYFGDSATAPLVQGICSELPERVVNLAGKTSLRELMTLIELCDVFLTNDSGPMHISSALGKPLVALFGSTSDVRTGPFCNATVIHKRVSCSPCYQRVCPIDFRCMKEISTKEVYRAVIEKFSSQ